MPDLVIATMTESDWPDVARVYAAGIATGHATFETSVPEWSEFEQGKHRHLCFVAREGNGLTVGCAWASPVSTREVYAGIAEESVYVEPSAAGRGVGRTLLAALLDAADAAGIWTVQAHIFPENVASLSLHAALGFREVGIRERVGLMRHGPMAGQWRDVVLLERRSTIT